MKISDVMTPWALTANLRDGLRQTFDRMHERNIRHLPVLGDDGRLVGIITERDVRRPDTLDEHGVAVPFVLDNSMRVEEAMTHHPDTVKADDDLLAAVDLMVKSKYGAIPVVDDAGALAGVVSAVDALKVLRSLLERGADAELL
jgi:acetoin utilization protein AcuB